MIYASHRAKGAPVLGALPGRHGPFGYRPAPGEDDDTATVTEEPQPAATVPTPRKGDGR
ncbi:hypothetical protein ACN6AT_36640 (plasmid) [Streptomyces sp. JL4002]|uniref:hypothetical protein n=1 Tax=Streptomyces sp. JL4002 TaxID=3404781 RepID=UPI003B283C00